jgi:DNA polymerase III alpha subunit
MGVDKNVSRLRKLCKAGIPNCYPLAHSFEADERLDEELAVVDRLGRAEEFLAAAGIHKFATKRDIPYRLIGAGCSSILTYLLGMTEVNPRSPHLPFERFCDPQGRRDLVFDLDVPQEYQQEILDFANDKYGEEFVKNKFNFSNMLKAVQVPYLVASLIRQEVAPSFTLAYIWQKSHFHRDPEVFEMLKEGNTSGVYWLDNEGVPELLRRIEPGLIDGLINLMALHLLSVDHANLPEIYLSNTEKRGFPGADNRLISRLLSTTNGLILYQEQIMCLLYYLCGIEMSEGYDFCRAAAKHKKATVKEFRERFVAGAKEIDAPTAKALFEYVHEAAVYALCKSHLAAEAQTAYQAAYLKLHYPEQFNRVVEEVRKIG